MPGALNREGIDKEKIVEIGLRCYFRMVFRDGFFHGDLHAGNFVVLDNSHVGLIDFGVVGRLNKRTQDSIASILVALAVEDYDRVAYEYVDLAPYSEQLDIDKYAKDLRDLIAPYYGLTLKNINIGKLLMDSAAVAAKHRVVIPSELMLFFKSMINIEALGRLIIQDFDFLKYSLDFAEELMRTKYEPKRMLKDMTDVGRDATGLLYDLPRQLRQLIRKLNSPNFVAKLQLTGTPELVRSVKSVGDLTYMGLLIGSLLIAGSMSLSFKTEITVLGLPLISAVFFSLAAFNSVIAFFNYIKKH
jgi:ubiquinone biosynthesis protein